ncbi:hypothetical protein LPTSP3_g10450 [Leptospira kobayashii]|uniref:Dolichyl-phosphate-mannose-protein mannosyltransferase n=1 Tax=Leptospira kobayashii TaxID=1917830 RepID=A0ABN6KBY3_9LEPT|nr:hypothetical protein [Leptospira kobayashii]BDA78115.1 hypothetical protein LPTSP3_g10450 [Leptospira kobayashii]
MTKIIFSYLILCFLVFSQLKHTPAGLVQDNVHKYFQTMDYVQSGGEDFSIHNHDYKLDPKNQFGIFSVPFAYLIQNKIYMTFPWLWVYLNAPVLKLFGFFGIYFIAGMAGLLSIFSLKSLLSHFTENLSLIRNTLYFYIFCSSLVIYSVWFYEGTLCSLCLFWFLDSELKRKTEDSYVHSALKSSVSLILLSILVLLRTEVFFLAVLIYFAAIFDSFSNLKKKLGYLVFYVMVPGFVFLYSNHLIWNNPQGLRFLATHSFTFYERLGRVFEYFFFEKYCMLFYLPTFFLTFFLFKDVKNLRKEIFFRVYLACLVFMVVIPLVSPQQQGSDIMPRFYFPIVPLLAFFVFYTIDRYIPDRKKLIHSFVFLQSGIYLAITMIVLIFTSKRMDRVYREISPYIGETNAVSNEFIGHLVQNAEIRNVYQGEGQFQLKRMTKLLSQNGKTSFHLFIWEPSYYEYYHKYLNANYEKIAKVEDIYIYRYKGNATNRK